MKNKILQLMTIIMLAPCASLMAGSSFFENVGAGMVANVATAPITEAINRPRTKTTEIRYVPQPAPMMGQADTTQFQLKIQQLDMENKHLQEKFLRVERENKELKKENKRLRDKMYELSK